MLTCREVTKLLSDSMDRNLPIGTRIGLRIHLTMCRLCSRYKKQLLFIRNVLRLYSIKLEEDEFSSDISLSPEAKQRLKNSLTSKK